MVASVVSSLVDIAIHRRTGGGGGGGGGGGPPAGFDLPLQLALDLVQRTLDSADDRAAELASSGGFLKNYLNVEERAAMLELAISLGAHHDRIPTPPLALITRAVHSLLADRSHAAVSAAVLSHVLEAAPTLDLEAIGGRDMVAMELGPWLEGWKGAFGSDVGDATAKELMQLLEVSLIESAPASFNENVDMGSLLPASEGGTRSTEVIKGVFSSILGK